MPDTVFQYIVTLVEYLHVLSLADFIDIACVTVLVYLCLSFLRGTNAGRVAIVLLAIVVFMWVSYWFRLNAIHFILSNAVELGLLAVVILFRPEIRRAMEKLGDQFFRQFENRSIPFFYKPSAPSSELMQAISETVTACAQMSESKTGALIVFERTTDLKEYMSTGTQFRSELNDCLLRTLFYHGCPTHDGAVIIRDGKIMAAGCFLPITDNKQLNRELGSRHRAGLGMSENSDAIVIIVSEETGTISVAAGGKLQRHLTPKTLEQRLKNELLPPEITTENKLRLFRHSSGSAPQGRDR